MNFILIPTDKLYKFQAVGSLVAIGVCLLFLYFQFSTIDKLITEIQIEKESLRVDDFFWENKTYKDKE